MKSRPDSDWGARPALRAAEAEAEAHERDTIPAPPPEHLHADADADGDSSEDERDTLRPGWESDPTRTFSAASGVRVNNPARQGAQFTNSQSAHSIPAPPAPPTPPPGAPPVASIPRPPPLPRTVHAVKRDQVRPPPLPGAASAFAPAPETSDDAGGAQASDVPTPTNPVSEPGARRPADSERGSAELREDEPTVPRTPIPQLIPPPPAGDMVVALPSFAPVTRTKPPELPGPERQTRARLAGYALAGMGVVLLGASWLLSEQASDGSDANASTAAQPQVVQLSPEAAHHTERSTATVPGALPVKATAEARAMPAAEAAPEATTPKTTSAPTAAKGALAAPSKAATGKANAAVGGRAPSPRKVRPTVPDKVAPIAARPSVAGKARPGAAEAAGAAAELPEVPTRSAVIEGLEALRPEVSACSGGRGGVARVDLSIAAAGTVAHAVVGGDFAGTAEGSCIARAVRKARFEPFKKDRYRIEYPYAL